MLTKLRIYNLAYAELLRRQDVERYQRPDSSVIKRNMMKRYDREIDELHELILNEEERIEKEKGE